MQEAKISISSKWFEAKESCHVLLYVTALKNKMKLFPPLNPKNESSAAFNKEITILKFAKKNWNVLQIWKNLGKVNLHSFVLLGLYLLILSSLDFNFA